jgi:hypothetical protein
MNEGYILGSMVMFLGTLSRHDLHILAINSVNIFLMAFKLIRFQNRKIHEIDS